MKRIFDVMASSFLLLVLALPIAVIALVVKISSKGPVLYWSDRVGRDNCIFKMPKFRSMRFDAPQVATHLLRDPDAYLTPVGSFLRRSSLDELPQLFSVLAGRLSLVGPRPALFNQDDLIALRTERGIQKLTPGITGWAQINGRDELHIPEKVSLDHAYLKMRSFRFDMKILLMTALKVARREGVSH
ncbi:MAG: sugar transferase [Terracidiphilus sp.]|jgi:O-antigen biosynthesis protein WbqP